MDKQQRQALKESLLEAGRIVLIAVMTYLVTEGTLGFLVDYLFGVRIDMALKLQITTVLTILAKAIDRALHESNILKRGMTGF